MNFKGSGMSNRILVIRLGALGDLTLCFGAFAAIRRAHPDAEIALLTMPAFVEFARKMPWFDRVLVDNRPPLWRVDEWWKLARQVRAFAPTHVYDLQGKFRQSVLFNLLGRPEWSGAARGCSHPRPWPPTAGMHYTDFVAAQLERAGVQMTAEVDTAWLDAPINQFDLPERYALLIPGCAPDRPYKRWPAAKYAELAMRLREQGISSVAIGTAHDAAAICEIVSMAGNVIGHPPAGIAGGKPSPPVSSTGGEGFPPAIPTPAEEQLCSICPAGLRCPK